MLRAIGDEVMPDLSGQRIVVVGGGNVAMDVARSAVRLGAEKVSIVYRRRICDMTAQDAEIAGAQAEGCEILEASRPLLRLRSMHPDMPAAFAFSLRSSASLVVVARHRELPKKPNA